MRFFLLLLLVPLFAPIVVGAQDGIPRDLPLEELRLKQTGDAISGSRLVADPNTGRVWEIRKTGPDEIRVVQTSQFKPWKPKKKLHKLAEILKMEPPRP